MLWDLIRDFFVQHVFGGFDSNGGLFSPNIGYAFNDGYDVYTGDDIYFSIGYYTDGTPLSMSFSDYLSTTATIISITIIVVLCCLFIKKIVSTVSHLFGN